MKNEWRVLAVVCLLVVGVYAYAARAGFMAWREQHAADTPYNKLVEGFQAGQLNLKMDVPGGLAQLVNPYDPDENAPYVSAKHGLNDLSYYKGNLYLYFGVTPALLLFWPFAALTGHYLYEWHAVVIFCALGFLASVGILCGLRRRYFPDVNIWVVAAGALALGLATAVPMLLPRSNANEVAISCAYMLTMLALGAIWRALDEPGRKWLWLMPASAAYGLALGARPTLVFGAIILLVPVVQAWRERRTAWSLLMAATVPITLIGLGLMFYNARRFDSPFEFGLHYQLLADRPATQQFFSLRYLWFNFRLYFLEPVRWSGHFPFVRDIAVPHLPAGHGWVEHPFGILTNVPVVWLALALPLAWRGRTPEPRSAFQGFIVVAALFLCVCLLIADLYYFTVYRFEAEILPILVLLAVIGILGLERALADKPNRRRTVRWVWGSLLIFSMAFNLLATVERCGDVYHNAGQAMQQLDRIPEAEELFQQALRLNPNSIDSHAKLGNIFLQEGKVSEALAHYEQVLSMYPNSAEAHYYCGLALMELGKVPEAVEQYEQTLRIKPDFVEAHLNLGVELEKLGRTTDAIRHYEETLRIRPESPEAHLDLGTALFTEGRAQEAIAHYDEALRIQPDYVRAYYNRGFVLEHLGKLPEAVADYEEAIRIKPDYARAHCSLGDALQKMGKLPEAVAQYEQALRVAPDDAEVHFDLALALEKLGRTREAIDQYRQTLKLRPDYTPARTALARLGAGQ
jgi:tetratricopeptide (TPR) repeat protein